MAWLVPKEGLLRVLIALKILVLGRFEPLSYGSNGKHANRLATEDDNDDLTETVCGT
jgi:hypothetical protein